MMFVLAVLALVSVTSAVPFSGTETTAQRLLNSKRDDDGMVRIGDMIMSESQILEYYGTPEERAFGEGDNMLRWPNAVIPYTIDPDFASTGISAMIKHAMKFWEAETCIKFEEITSPSTPHVFITNRNKGCNAHAGSIVNKYSCLINEYDCLVNQTLNLEMPGCQQLSTIIHEFGHTIGLLHEQTRPNRDDYMNIFLNNTIERHLHDLAKRTNDVLFSNSYDFTSIMHYWILGGSKEWNRLILTPKDPTMTPLINRSFRPSFLDYRHVNLMYNCQEGCNVQCMNGGFPTRSTAKGCHCLCPYDTTGYKCENKLQVDVCSYIIKEEATFRPPNRYDQYDETPKCSFIIKAPAGKKVSLEFRSMNMDCQMGEHVIIRNSDLTGDTIYMNFCRKFSNQRTQPFISEGNEMQLILMNKVWEDAFQAHITFV